MILDATLTFSENQAVTATAISENVIKLVDAGTVYGESAAITRDLGAGNPLPIAIQVTEDFATCTSVTITIETSAAAALTSSTVLATSGAIPVASLVAGYKAPLRFFPEGDLLDYVGIRYTVAGSDATAGTITAALATVRDSA